MVIEEENRERYKLRKIELKKPMSKLSAHQRYHLKTDGKVDASIYIEIISLPSEDPGKIAFKTQNVSYEGAFVISADGNHLDVTSGDLVHQITPVQSADESYNAMYLVHNIFQRNFVFALADSNIQESGLKRFQLFHQETDVDCMSVYESDSETHSVQQVKVARRKKGGWNLVRAAVHHRFGTLDKRRKHAGLLARNTFQTGYDLVDLWSDPSEASDL